MPSGQRYCRFCSSLEFTVMIAPSTEDGSAALGREALWFEEGEHRIRRRSQEMLLRSLAAR